jgi:hypothetical protein
MTFQIDRCRQAAARMRQTYHGAVCQLIDIDCGTFAFCGDSAEGKAGRQPSRDRPRPRVGNHDGRRDLSIGDVSAKATINATRADYEDTIQNQRVVW